MRENRTSGSVRGAFGNGRSYREIENFPVRDYAAAMNSTGWIIQNHTLPWARTKIAGFPSAHP
uniref:Uncharacterized protein n=1 Tax=Candidatus Kentrum sp. LPFa TaxID=2126335 RepID=A0A450XE77_9GAMM|nr:MAG: hypothetical protein BECKLPF1236A_GA0070988_1005012 [Candidatus Kentron sp. LPFa]VFK27564.1 MAG: hypothetical protein BECKLPF1236C_GA0070990_1004812 [Candidatus Kentron sp. LPFa]